MKKIAILLLVLTFSVLSTTQLFSMQNAEDEKFQKLVDEYFDAYWKFYPTAATIAGFTKYNDKLEDFREKAIDNRRGGGEKVIIILRDKFSYFIDEQPHPNPTERGSRNHEAGIVPDQSHQGRYK